MIREIIKPEGNTYILNLPDEMVGKTIEVVVCEIEEKKPTNGLKKTVEELSQEISGLTLNLTGFTFDRSEANDYE